MASNSETLVLLSGGIDSSGCLHFARDIGRPLSAMFFDYGQAAVREELVAAMNIAEEYAVPLNVRRLADARLKTTGITSCRNAFLLATAAMEASDSVTAIAIGVHRGTDYFDCSEEFVQSMDRLVRASTMGRVGIMAPFVKWSKVEVWQYCLKSGVPMQLTYSCEAGGPEPCGSCLSCKDREALHAQA